MHQDMFGFGSMHFLEHQETQGGFWDYVQNSSVCPLGKLGAFTIICWLLISTMLLLTIDVKTSCLVVSIVSIVMYFIMNGMSIVMNQPLGIRAFPFFFFEFGVSALLISIVV